MYDTEIITTQPARAEPSALRLNVRLADGERFQLAAKPGMRVTDLLRAYGLPVKSVCLGSGVCSGCHVRIPHEWQTLLSPPDGDERTRLDAIPAANATSRLACQLVMNENLDGLQLEVQPDSLVPQTFWVAG